MTKILIFGTFDGIHEGHRAMLRQAKEMGSYVTAAVTPDHIVEDLKGKPPKRTAAERIQALKDERLADEVILSDSEPNSWAILKKVKPQMIALGYDQEELRRSLEEQLEQTYPDIETEEGWQTHPKKPTIVILDPYQPEKYKSSKLYK